MKKRMDKDQKEKTNKTPKENPKENAGENRKETSDGYPDGKAEQSLKNSPFLTGLTFLHAAFLLAPVLPLVYDIVGMGEKEVTRQFWLGAFLLVPVVLSWLAVRYCKALWLYSLSGMAAIALAAVVTGNPVFAALTAFLWLIRGSARIKKGKIKKEYMDMPVGEGQVRIPELSEIPMFLDIPRPGHFIVFVLYYLASLPLRTESIYRYIFGILFAEILVCFLYRYLTGFREYVEQHQTIANLPVHTMQKIVRLLLVPALLILLLVMIPSLLYGKEPLTDLHFDPVEGTVTLQPDRNTVYPDSQIPEVLSGLQEGNPLTIPRWLEILFQFFAWVIFAVFTILVLRALYHAVRTMNRSFLKEEEDEITFLGEEDRKEKLNGRSKTTFRLLRTPDEQIRIRYKKVLRRAIRRRRKNPKGTETPTELECLADVASAANPETDPEALHVLYEKARYSQKPCTVEEARQADRLKL